MGDWNQCTGGLSLIYDIRLMILEGGQVLEI
jgi:hypothetical protein